MYRLIPTDPLLTHSVKNGGFHAIPVGSKKKAEASKLRPFQHLRFTAGERIRTADVQLGKLPLSRQERLNHAINKG